MTREEIIEFHGSEMKERIPNPYGKIPVVEWLMNEERMSLYEEIAGMTEAINKTIGEKANDVESFAEAYLAVMGAELDEEGVMRIRDNRVINIYGTDNAKDVLVQFLQKPTADGTQENLLDRLEKWIHKISMVCDINSESFGNASGVALEYKLHPMRSLAGNLERKALKSMRKRYKLFCTLSTNVPNKDAWRELEQTSTLNLPKNGLEEAQTAQALDGIVSKETQLKVLSIVGNVQDEIDKMEKESEEASKKAEERFGQMMFGQQQQTQGQTPQQEQNGVVVDGQ
jgi:SPP1 family phage portal protein